MKNYREIVVCFQGKRTVFGFCIGYILPLIVLTSAPLVARTKGSRSVKPQHSTSQSLVSTSPLPKMCVENVVDTDALPVKNKVLEPGTIEAGALPVKNRVLEPGAIQVGALPVKNKVLEPGTIEAGALPVKNKIPESGRTKVDALLVKNKALESNKIEVASSAVGETTPLKTASSETFKLGIENISDNFVAQFRGKRIGLITNQTGLDQQGRRTVDILKDKGLSIAYLFAPEHGIDGTAGAGERVTNSVDKKTNISIISLYGHGTGKMIPLTVLSAIDVIMFDIQDSGMRHYTYVSTMFHAMRVAQEHGKRFVVFDRPNPLGVAMEGPLVEDKLRSFISIAAIPLRHGMTMGELAWYFNVHELKKPVDLLVVKMRHYNRRDSLSDLTAPLSPGLRTMQACYGYSFLGLLGEIAPFGIGLHTEARYQCIVLPKKMGVTDKVWERLRHVLKKQGIDTVLYEYNHPKSNVCLRGLRLPIKDINKVHAFSGLYTVLRFFNKEGIPLSFSRSFDLAVGTSKIREVVQGKQPHALLMEHVNTQLAQFLDKAKSSFMYTPFPTPYFIK